MTVDRRHFLHLAGLTTLGGAAGAVGLGAGLAGCGAQSQAMTAKPIRFPPPLQEGDLLGITSPSAGVKAALRPRMDFAYETLNALGYRYREGCCLWGEGLLSAPAAERSAELQGMLFDPAIAAVFPPDGGELLIDLLPWLDFAALAEAPPKWVLGYSDLSTFMLPYTLLTGIATLSGTNLWECPVNPTAPGLAHWQEVVTLAPGATFSQRAADLYQPHDSDWAQLPPDITHFDRTAPVRWQCLGREDQSAYRLEVSGRLIGGTLDVIGMLAGSAYGDLRRFASLYAHEGLLLYLDNCDYNTAQYCRALHHLRLAGWFDVANAVLIGRTAAAAVEGFSQRDALLNALGDLDIPVLYDLDIGHLPPQLMLINGALASLHFGPGDWRIDQTLA
ncbi:MAG TPA: LD-carboxypeptidase [Chromatiaceae bacterium]|nr:LD-carboxypeptidase [Chromatiaceae bacterium]